MATDSCGVSVGAWSTAGNVPGLKVRVRSGELAAHLRDRADYHDERADEKAKELPKLKEATDAIRAHAAPGVAHMNKASASNYRFDGDSAVEQLEADVLNHRNKATALRWLAEHLFEQDYCLDRPDLVQLEILKN